MCGISGLISSKIINQSKIDFLHKINEELTMRGPDHKGTWINENKNTLLNHTRLSILDSSDNGNQPMHFKHLTITFNGEIYNHHKLRNDLTNKGYDFHSYTDTEVILKMYYHYGKDCLKMLEGQFAFAIWNNKKEQLFIARDPFGQKPFYYKFNNNEFWFSSYLPSLLKYNDKTLDYSAIYFYFKLGIIPAPYTPFKEYKKLSHGTAAIIDIKNNKLHMKTWKYYELKFDTINSNITEKESIKVLKQSLINSIDKRLLNNVNSCIFLSGGLDSSLITAITYKELGKPIPIIGIGFENTFNHSGDEFIYADYVAKTLNTKLNKNFISNSYIYQNIKDCYTSINEPMWAYDMMGHYFLSKFANKKGIKIAFSGMGADELWMGYKWHKEFCEYSNIPASKTFNVFLEDNSNINLFLNDKFIKELDLNKYIKTYFNKLEHHSCTEFDKILHSELHLFMPEDSLKRSDSTTMRHGVEVRSPFLDKEIINLGCKIPYALKRKNNTDKYLLKKIANEYFKKDFIHRPKGYFPVAPIQYFSNEIAEFCKDVLTSKKFNYYNIYDTKYVLKILNKQNKSNLEKYILWKITCLECWLQQFPIK